MTVSATNAYTGPLYGNGSTTAFPFTFKALTGEEVAVYLDGALVSSALYSVTLSSSGGTVTFDTAPADDTVVLIVSSPSFAQDIDLEDNGAFLPEVFDEAHDRSAVRDLVLKAPIDALFDPVWLLPDTRAGKFMSWDGGGDPALASGTGADDALRTDLADPDGSGSALSSYKQDSVFAVNRSVRSRLREFKMTSDVATCDGVADDTDDFYGFCEEVSDGGGGMIWLPPNAILRLTEIQTAPPNIKLNLNGAKLLLDLAASGSGFDPGFRLGSGCGVFNGTVEVDSNPTGVGTQAGHHACFTIGPMYGEGGTAASPSALHDTEDFFLRDLTLISNADGRALIQLMGGVHDFEISNIKAGASSTAAIGIALDWGSVGDVDTSGGGDVALTYAAINATRGRYDSGLAYSMHPHGGTIKGITAGALSRADSYGIRMAGAYGIEVSDCEFAQTKGATILATGGDVGQEFMRAADLNMAMKNIVIERIMGVDCDNGYGVRLDSEGDNVRVATTHGTPYVAQRALTIPVNLVVRDSSFFSDGGASVVDGATVSYCEGAKLENCHFRGFRKGIDITNGSRRVKVIDCTTSFNRENGHNVDGATSQPEDCEIIKARSHDNGQAAGSFSGIYVASAKRTLIDGCIVGKDGANDSGQDYGIRVTVDATDTEVRNNTVLSTLVTTGVAYQMAGGTDFNKIRLFSNNKWIAAHTALPYAGVTLIPISPDTSDDDRTPTIYKMDGSAVLTGAVLVDGDILQLTNPAAGGLGGFNCTVGGTVGSGAELSPYPAGGSCTVAQLPAASATLKSLRSMVTDSNATLAAGIGNTVAGGGANIVPVHCDGTNWKIG